MNLFDATTSYEAWLRLQTRVVERDLGAKHVAMAEGPLPLLRATFYRFLQLWSEHAGPLARAPKVLAVGDLHVENFGTWRDGEGRLIWGINDFDEAYPLPFTLDLVRLATSVHLATQARHLSVRSKDSCAAILTGYMAGLECGGQPFVLAEHNTWLWQLAVNDLREPKLFWRAQDGKCSVAKPAPPAALTRFVQGHLPKGTKDVRVLRRSAGKGSLGRERFLFRGQWNGGSTAREAKAVVPSACVWLAGKSSSRSYYGDILRHALRSPDPALQLHGSWIVRRLAPDCSKIELAHLPNGHDESKLLWAMGFETANIHLGTRGARARISRALSALPAHWLHATSKLLADAVKEDWQQWRARTR